MSVLLQPLPAEDTSESLDFSQQLQLLPLPPATTRSATHSGVVTNHLLHFLSQHSPVLSAACQSADLLDHIVRGEKTSVEIPGAETAAPALVVGDCNIGVTLTAEQFPAAQRSLLRVELLRGPAPEV